MPHDHTERVARALSAAGDRRAFLRQAALLGAAAVAPRPFPRLRWLPRFAEDPFTLGVASGEPLPDGIVLWTRLILDSTQGGGGVLPEGIDVSWEVAEDEAFGRVVRRGSAHAEPEAAHAVHVEVEGLEPDRVYFYRFVAAGIESPHGRTRTAPADGATPARIPFAFTSCQNFEQGFYTAHRHLAEEELSFVVHLGDYIYEDGAVAGRVRQHGYREIKILEDYRDRYALYKADADLKAAHAVAPWIVVWDDHEVDNNYANDQDEHDTSPEQFLLRRAAGYRAYWEHQPIRRASLPQGPSAQLYRRLRFGSLIQLHMLDGRQYRTDQPCDDGIKPRCPDTTDPRGSMLGAAQESWLQEGLTGSRATWNVLGNQVPFAPVDNEPGDAATYSMDRWDGYVAARQRLLDFLRDRRPANPIVITGDIHSNWVAELHADFDDPASPKVGVEFVGTSISSGGDGSDMSDFGRRALEANPHMRFHNNQRGYVRCAVTPRLWTTDYRVVPYVTRPGAPVATRASFAVEAGRPGVTQT